MSESSRDYPLHLLLFEEGDARHMACCLDFHLFAGGSSAESALHGLELMIRDHVEQCARLGRVPLRPTPQEYWERWYRAWARAEYRPLVRPFEVEIPAEHVRFEANEAVAA